MEEYNQNGSENDATVADNSNQNGAQVSMTVFEQQMKNATKKGRAQGFWVSIVVFVCILLLIQGIKLAISIANGSFYADTLSVTGGSLIDKKTAQKVNKIYRIIDKSFIDEVDEDALKEGMFKGMLEALDEKYTTYYTVDEFTEMMEDAEGSFEGIGAYLSQDPDTMVITVVRPILNSPAEAAGLLAGDVLVSVDGEDVSDQDLNLVVTKVRGEKGTSVRIGISREGEEDTIYFDIVRDKVDSISCDYEMLDGNIGHIVISEFADATARQFKDSYNSLVEDGMTSLIIDLRSNGGGYVDTSVDIADFLIKDGLIVTIKDRDGKGYSYEDKGDDDYLKYPCVVLVDGNTASASEILTGALKDHEVATIIGTQTFGKGIVQDVVPLGDGSGIKYTSNKYYTPNGDNIHGVGIEPDIIVEWDVDAYREKHEDNQLEAAINYLTKGSIE